MWQGNRHYPSLLWLRLTTKHRTANATPCNTAAHAVQQCTHRSAVHGASFASSHHARRKLQGVNHQTARCRARTMQRMVPQLQRTACMETLMRIQNTHHAAHVVPSMQVHRGGVPVHVIGQVGKSVPVFGHGARLHQLQRKTQEASTKADLREACMWCCSACTSCDSEKPQGGHKFGHKKAVTGSYRV